MITNLKARISFQTLGLTAYELSQSKSPKHINRRAEIITYEVETKEEALKLTHEIRKSNTFIDASDLWVKIGDTENKLLTMLFMPEYLHNNEMRDYVFFDFAKEEVVISLTNNLCFKYTEDNKLFGISLSTLRKVQDNTTLIMSGLDMLPDPTTEYVVVEVLGSPYHGPRFSRGILETELEFAHRLIADKDMCKDLISAYVEARKQSVSTTDGGDRHFVPRNKRGNQVRGEFGQRSAVNTQTHLFISGETIALATLEKVFKEVSENFTTYVNNLFNKIERFAKEMEKIEIGEVEAHREFYTNLDILKDVDNEPN